MITKLEQKFYDTFGIEPYIYYDCLDDYKSCNRENCIYCGAYRKLLHKPNITAEKLLEMICVCSTVYPLTINFKETIDELKEFILDFCIRHNTELGIEQIKSLFIRGDN